MDIKDAQSEMCETYLSGFAGHLVSGILWGISAFFATFSSEELGILFLVFGGFFIFPATKLVLKLLKIPDKVSKDNPLNALAMQVAFILPLLLPLVYFVIQVDRNLFYPSFILILGVHYLPFITLYGTPIFGFIAVIFITVSILLMFLEISIFSLGGWFTSAFFILMAIYTWITVNRKKS